MVIASRLGPQDGLDGRVLSCMGGVVADIITVVWKGATRGESFLPALNISKESPAWS